MPSLMDILTGGQPQPPQGGYNVTPVAAQPMQRSPGQRAWQDTAQRQVQGMNQMPGVLDPSALMENNVAQNKALMYSPVAATAATDTAKKDSDPAAAMQSLIAGFQQLSPSDQQSLFSMLQSMQTPAGG